tara:strand:- start:1439 stop:1885 length:447 start_codon:yes stop_codon:yes gene_type:complete
MNVQRCKEDIKRHEGEVLEIYIDSLGFKTLGVGHLCQPEDPEYDWEVGTAVSQEVVDAYYDSDFDKHMDEAVHVIGQDIWNTLPGDIQEVLINMCFNLGGTRLGKFKNMLNAVEDHDWERMAIEMEDSRWFKQVGRRSIELQEKVRNV